MKENSSDEVTVAGIVVDDGGNDGWSFRKDCTDLVRRISLLTHLLEEIREFRARPVDDAASAATATSDDVDVESSWLSDLVGALRAAKRLLSLAGNFHSKSTFLSSSSDHPICSSPLLFLRSPSFTLKSLITHNLNQRYGGLNDQAAVLTDQGTLASFEDSATDLNISTDQAVVWVKKMVGNTDQAAGLV
ncbi:hypothetical protein SO802_031275 [Lithocarpus litseifolius]|uniref:PUB 12/19-like N-terminal domain-containing protein n=1 Tax=Lithocarpus litseifolius TaxID=425828 RepID=A0AAW2BN53_9ROSI